MIGVFGDVTLDITAKTDGPLQWGSDVVGTILLKNGGSAANFAAWLGFLRRRPLFVGSVGQDQWGQAVEVELTRCGVKTYLTAKDQASTGTILVLVDEKGERTMVTDRGANLLLKPFDFPPDFFNQIRHLHVTGYSFFGGLDLLKTTTWALRQAGKQDLAVSVDPSSYALLHSFGPARFLQMTQGADFVFPNLVEGQVLSGERDPWMIVRFLLDYYECVVLTLGAEGCLCGTASGIHQVPGRNVHVEDTTGAGDAFAAGFLGEFYQSGDLLKALNSGSEAAGECVQHIGARPV